MAPSSYCTLNASVERFNEYNRKMAILIYLPITIFSFGNQFKIISKIDQCSQIRTRKKLQINFCFGMQRIIIIF